LDIKDEYNSYYTKLRRIRDEAFSGCSNLKIFEWPDDLRVIHTRGFAECRKLASYKIGRNIRFLQSGAFIYTFAAEYQEQKLLNLHLPSTLETIERSTFAGLSGDRLGARSIDKLYFGSGLSDVMKVKTSIEDGAFTSTNINKVIVFCNPEDFQNWNTPEMKRLFNNAEIVEGTGV
jgi:hypothetical protein